MNQTILIIDDNEAMRMVLLHFLIGRGDAARAAATGPEAVQLLRQDRFDCALVDVQLSGGRDGIALAGDLRQIQKDLKIIIMSANLEALARAAQAGFQVILPKPISFRELESALQQ